MTDEGRNPIQPDPELERLIELAMRSCGWLLPRTLADVRQAEQDPEIQSIELPESLRDPFRVLARAADVTVGPAADASCDAVSEVVSIPAALAQLAMEEGLSYQQTLTLLSWHGQQFANRSSTKKDQPDFADWKRLYQDVKEFL